MTDWYDHPEYFDLIFADETDAEVAFFEAAFEKFAGRTIQSVFEPGCGSGRLIAAMVDLDYEATGLDLNQKMLDFLAARLEKTGHSAELIRGDMSAMKLPKTYDAAFCTFNTFRHLLTEEDVVGHLRSLADHIEPGGLYILGFHIIPLDADEEEVEQWEASNDDFTVDATLAVIEFDRDNRREKLKVTIDVTHKDGSTDQIETVFPLRLYTCDEASEMLQSVNDVWEIAGIYDFDYDIDEERDMDDDLCDAVFVLRRK
ncbi:class I SAM-dependent methyltransferase [Planctomycetes bacterium K23_9]|uniref:dTDP-3-amino-3,4, 6-trideoxy-alpha-D-glucopyranose n=1 Tax=Stieleria marina TaxID=1930275 RepID=A0A517NTV6_9BACT|nr:dTDP-3-amino-3,4,6-trideoxy-alpha-D-glucopyranose [Planctomycetes bacterium K23_9]